MTYQQTRQGIIGCILLALVLLTAGCSSESPSGDPPDDTRVLQGKTVRLLLVGDPFALAFSRSIRELEKRAGGTIRLEMVGYDDVRQQILYNAKDSESTYDIVSFDVVWTGEFGAKGILLPLNRAIAAGDQVNGSDFLQVAWTGSAWGGKQLGIPIQPHAELLWYRRDLFDDQSVSPPQTTEQVLQVARRFHDPGRGMYGICWNAQRGQPLGQSMAHFYAAFGQPLLDDQGRPTLNTARGIAAARYAKSLMAVSPPDILSMAWDQRTGRFASGKSAMTYGWAARTFMAEAAPTSQVKGKVGYLPAPHAMGCKPVTPLGTWSLGIPANIGPRRALAERFLMWLMSAEIQKLIAEAGNGGLPRHAMMQDDHLVDKYHHLPTMYALEQQGDLGDWMRPSVPQWPNLADILGTVYHDMLSGQLTPEAAAAEAQRRAEELFESSTADGRP